MDYSPSPDTVREHLEQAREFANKPNWYWPNFSIQLLLGLRDADVDRELLDIGATMTPKDGPSMEIGPQDLTELAQDRSIYRIVRLVTQHFSTPSFAWLIPTGLEVAELLEKLKPYWTAQQTPTRKNRWPTAFNRLLERCRKPDYSLRWQPTSLDYASLCDLGVRFGNEQDRALLRELPAQTWLERVSLKAAFNEQAPRPTLTEVMSPSWLPKLPPALIRDPLTGLLSRAAVCEDPHRHAIQDKRVFVKRLPAPAVIMLDVDRMKYLNDRYGFRVGDTVLRTVAEQLQMLVGDRVIRFGGDEQMILWESDNVGAVAQEIVDSVRGLHIHCPDCPNENIQVTISAGVACGEDTEKVLLAADEALNRAKVAGRDRIEIA